MKTRLALLACATTVLASLHAQQQLPPVGAPTFRSGVDVVQIDVSVLDGQRHPVRGLTAADFTVLEDGKAREVVAFSAIELPPPPSAPASGAAAIAPDVVRNATATGRMVVILIDPFMTRMAPAGDDTPALVAMRVTARRIVDSLAPGDQAAVVHVKYGGPQNFTADKARLKKALDSSAFGTNVRDSQEEYGDCHCGVCQAEAITRISEALDADKQQRKTLFFVGERIRLAPEAGPCSFDLERATRRMLQATQRANVTVHAIDPNGMETTNVRAGDRFGPENASAAAAVKERNNRAFLIERHDSLRALADWTGGRAVLNTNEQQASVRPILDESSAYYLLAFQAPAAEQDGKFHAITVKVNRPGVQVRTRKGYVTERAASAESAARPATLDDVTRQLLPDRGLPLSITAAPFRGADGKPALVVTTGVRAPASATAAVAQSPAPADAIESVEILTTAIREGEKSTPFLRERLSFAIPGAPPGALRYETVSTLPLPPGKYEVRVATRHERAGSAGSVHTYVDVPDFASAELSVSGVVLLDRRAPTATPTEALGGLLRAAPTTRREFRRNEAVTALARVYQGPRRSATPLTVSWRVLDGNLREATASSRELTAEALDKAGAEAPFELPLTTLEPGDYVLRLDVARGATALRRDVRFTVN